MVYSDLAENTLMVTKEPLAGNTLPNLFRLLKQNKFNVDLRYLPRVIYSVTLSSMMAPFRIREHVKFKKAIEAVEIQRDPLFIIGHWRSGTTYLHNIISLDKNFGYFSTFHATLPSVFLTSEQLFKPFVAYNLPKKRPMDDVSMEADLPQEDEYALAACSPYSNNHALCFPRNAKFYTRFIGMENVPEKIITEWKNTYLYLLKKETLYSSGKRLVVKNPANTARIQLIRELFPDAQFIHIYRNPYHVFLSMRRLIGSIVPFLCVQVPPKFEEAEKLMMMSYTKMYKKFFEEKRQIPEGNLIEVKYEDFLQHPLQEIKRIYTTLDLKGFPQAETRFHRYITSQKQVKPSTYELNTQVTEKVLKEWGFTFKEFGYDPSAETIC